MHTEGAFNPEVEPKMPISLVDLDRQIESDLTQGVSEDLNQDQELIEFEETLDRSLEIGANARERFKSLIPHSLKKPEKSYEDRETPDYSQAVDRKFLELLKSLKQEASAQEFELTKKAYLGSLQSEDESSTEVEERMTEFPEVKMQQVHFEYRQEGGVNMIQETVTNFLKESEFNSAKSHLVIRNLENGLKINLEQLLPNDYEFSPQELIKTEKYFNEETKKSGYRLIPVDLKSYGGTKDSEGSFYEQPITKKVAYGDLTEKGGMLTLLHETAHSWQSVYYEESSEAGKFRETFQTVRRELEIISHFLDKVQKGALPKDTTYLMAINPAKQRLSELGVELDESRLASQDDGLDVGEVKMSSIKYPERHFIIRTNRFDELLKNYMREERDAWAHAIRMLRSLRKEGIDLEPELKTVDDFKAKVHQALGTYQEGLEKMIESSTQRIRFANKPSGGQKV